MKRKHHATRARRESLAKVETVPEHESQHGLGRATGIADKRFKAALLGLSHRELFHTGRSG